MDTERRVLIVEDDANLVNLLTIHLRDLGFTVDCAASGTDGLKQLLDGGYRLAILDIMLPGMDGLEVCRRVREVDKMTPILMLTAKSEEIDKVVGLELGADDYLAKPFSIHELLARVKAITRRVEEIQKGGVNHGRFISFGKLRVDTERRNVQIDDKRVELTAKEFDLLSLLAGNPGRAFSREQLLDQVWGYSYLGYSHTVNSHINRLRGKIEDDPSNPFYVRTVWGFGYRFASIEELNE
jgi:DNA-binding response OmpR family regulator